MCAFCAILLLLSKRTFYCLVMHLRIQQCSKCMSKVLQMLPNTEMASGLKSINITRKFGQSQVIPANLTVKQTARLWQGRNTIDTMANSYEGHLVFKIQYVAVSHELVKTSVGMQDKDNKTEMTQIIVKFDQYVFHRLSLFF